MPVFNWRVAKNEDTGHRDYKDGNSRRAIRAMEKGEDFNLMLAALKELDLRLPRVSKDRDATGKETLADVPSSAKAVA